MARASAINPVASGVLGVLNVPSIRALCPGGVSRNRHRDGAPPFIAIGPCREEQIDGMGLGYGALVEVPIHVITGGLDTDGEARGVEIADAVMALLDEPAAVPVTGYQNALAEWVGTDATLMQFQDGALGYDVAVTFRFSVFPV
jgi:hypothetical protein